VVTDSIFEISSGDFLEGKVFPFPAPTARLSVLVHPVVGVSSGGALVCWLWGIRFHSSLRECPIFPAVLALTVKTVGRHVRTVSLALGQGWDGEVGVEGPFP